MDVDNTEEMILSPEYMPEYMRKSRYFRIEYLEPETRFSNWEGSIYLGNHPDCYDIADKICELIKQSYQT
jgi:hypothetical protein